MINVAILGAGIGKAHLDGYRKLPDRFRVSTLCDLDKARARAATDDDSSISIVSSINDVMTDPDVELVDICLPPHLHTSHVIQTLAAGKHVICEKPLARSLAEIEQIRQAMESSGCRVFPVFQYRYGLGLAQLSALQASGLTGRAMVASAETHWNRDGDYYAVPWRGTWQHESGGAVLGHAIHMHDLICDILGPVATLNAFTDTRVNKIETEDCAAIILRMTSGALVTSSVTLGSASDTSRLKICFENLSVESGTAPYTPAEDIWTFTARGTTPQSDIDQVIESVPAPRAGFAGFLEATADALDNRGGREVTFVDGQRSIEFVTAVYLSARRGGVPITLPIERDHAVFQGWLPD